MLPPRPVPDDRYPNACSPRQGEHLEASLHQGGETTIVRLPSPGRAGAAEYAVHLRGVRAGVEPSLREAEATLGHAAQRGAGEGAAGAACRRSCGQPPRPAAEEGQRKVGSAMPPGHGFYYYEPRQPHEWGALVAAIARRRVTAIVNVPTVRGGCVAYARGHYLRLCPTRAAAEAALRDALAAYRSPGYEYYEVRDSQRWEAVEQAISRGKTTAIVWLPPSGMAMMGRYRVYRRGRYAWTYTAFSEAEIAVRHQLGGAP